MTTPAEMVASIYLARAFLMELMDPQLSPRVPRAIRREARARLKHFPADVQLETLAREILKRRNPE